MTVKGAGVGTVFPGLTAEWRNGHPQAEPASELLKRIYVILFPPANEQRRIADALDELLSDVDAYRGAV